MLFTVCAWNGLESNEQLKRQYKEVMANQLSILIKFSVFLSNVGEKVQWRKFAILWSNILHVKIIWFQTRQLLDRAKPQSVILLGYHFFQLQVKRYFFLSIIDNIDFKWIKCNFGDLCARIDPSFDSRTDLTLFQVKNKIIFDFVKCNDNGGGGGDTPKEKRRFNRMGYPGTPRISNAKEKLHIVLEKGQPWPPRADSTISFLTRVDEKFFRCSTQGCWFKTCRVDHLARHVKSCTVRFFYFFICLIIFRMFQN